jgi:hypothetical protein
MAIQRTAQGKMVDMSQLAARNEKVRAVGNMNVNARGDVVDSHNKVITDNTKRVKPSYQNVVSKPATQQAPAPVKPTQPTIQPDEPVELTKEEQELFDDDEDIVK